MNVQPRCGSVNSPRGRSARDLRSNPFLLRRGNPGDRMTPVEHSGARISFDFSATLPFNGAGTQNRTVDLLITNNFIYRFYAIKSTIYANVA